MKISKKILIIPLLLIICVIIFMLCINKKNTGSSENPIILSDSYSREAYLNLKGWEVTLIKSDIVNIPESFDGVYSEYAAIQEKQKLPLKNCKGMEAERFLYSVDNYNGTQTVYGELLVIDNRLVAAALIGNSPESFIKEIY